MRNIILAVPALVLLASCSTLGSYGKNFVANAAYDVSDVAARLGDVAAATGDLASSDAAVQARIDELASSVASKSDTQEAGALAALAAALAGAGVNYMRNRQRRKRGEPVTEAEARKGAS